MKSRKLKYDFVPLFFLVVFMIVSFACKVNYKEKKSIYEGRVRTKNENSLYRFLSYVSNGDELEKTDLERIKKRGKLIALTGYGPTSYFVYKGTPMGFEYDLLKLLSKELGVQLEIVVVKDMDQIIPMLNRGEGDIIADNLTVTKDRDALVAFTYPILKTKQVLVQRKPKDWEQMSYSTLEEHLVRSPIQLIGRKVHVRRASAYYSRLVNLSEEIGGDIEIQEESGETETEELIAKVSEGKIPYTVSDENTAMLHAKFYPNVDVRTPISFEQRISWAVREDSPLLLDKVNQWIKKVKKEGEFYAIYNKYYKDRRGIAEMVKCSRSSMCGRKISPYDPLIIKQAANIGWDWRLLASLIYQESQFNPNAKSWAGACGLMQLMPGTAQCFGASNPEDPVESLVAGTKYLKWLEKYWEKKVPDKNERIKFIIASYNVGQEHVADAQRLAIKYKKDPHKWDNNVAYYLLQKSKDKYCNDPVVKYGYCRGSEPFAYVNNILERYEHYKKLIREAA
jgi:membrane-bound lytic murein transglycosylase F